MSTADPLICFRERLRLPPETILSEGAAVMLLVHSSLERNWNALYNVNRNVHYGIATLLLQMASEIRPDEYE
jgi:hypothetical protein